MMGMPREFELEEVLTAQQIALAVRFFKRSQRTFYANCLAQIVEPSWDHIVRELGPCSKMYVTYGIEYRCLKMRKPKTAYKHKHNTFFRVRGQAAVNARQQWTSINSQIHAAERLI
jgi:hypothetical protein